MLVRSACAWCVGFLGTFEDDLEALRNAFSKKLDNHAAAVSLYVAHYNLCRVHESLRTTPALAQGIADRVWSIGDLLDAGLIATKPSVI